MSNLAIFIVALLGSGIAAYFLKTRSMSTKETELNNKLSDLDNKVKQEQEKLQTITKPEEKKMSPDEVSDYWKKELGDKK